ncbi:endo-1,4-beta-xylanase [Xanthomonas phaseoli]|uniref:endo-1,4-beta-xylanase n=1 Tax=Xanthomonas phaseoli TaxID=1985254 RepID=UPI001E2F87D5|nr:endo-1,4-beta-xylanase [Xanthomonas phaseoli]
MGSAYSPQQAQGFTNYWNAAVPENAGKWGSVEAVRGQMNWGPLDEAYQLAKRNHIAVPVPRGSLGCTAADVGAHPAAKRAACCDRALVCRHCAALPRHRSDAGGQ